MNWIHWPATKYNTKLPWYDTTRRLIFFVPAFAVLFVFLGLVYLGWGKKVMLELWNDIV